jgi:glycosyltransferase involved in cell wall biosynthesis
MKIAIVAPSEIPARRANTLQVMKMAQAFASTGHEVRLAAPGERTTDISWNGLARHYGLRTRFAIELLPARPPWRRYDYGWRSVRWAQRWGADLLYTRLPQTAALGSLSGCATVLEIHDLPQGRTGPLLLKLFLRGSGCRKLVAITHSLADDLAAKLINPRQASFVLISPDGVDLERYANLPDANRARSLLRNDPNLPKETRPAFAEPSPSGGFIAGYTGHLYRGRGIEQIFAMAEHLPEVIFLLAGGEPQEVERLRERARNQGRSNVVLTGFVPNAALPFYQAACDVLLMPYQQQVAASSGGDIARYLSPMKLFEYLACGRPILSSDLPVLREILNPNNAVLLPAGDVSAWVKAIQELRLDPERSARLGEQARLDASRYTWEGRAAQILEGL